MYWTRILLIVQITTVRSSIIDPFRSFLWAISLNNSFLSFGNLSAERFLNYLLANYAFLNFDLLSVRSLNFFKISAPFFIRPFFIIGDCVYYLPPSFREPLFLLGTYAEAIFLVKKKSCKNAFERK